MPGSNHVVSNTDKPFVRQPRYEEQAAGSAADEQRKAEERSILEAHDALGEQADKIDGTAGQRAENAGLVTRAELDQLLLQHQQQMQGVMALFEMFQQNDPRRGTPPTEDFMESERKVYEHTISELTNAPREAVYIVPLGYEAQAIEQAGGKPLWRVICINGVQFPVEVGKVTEVPYQIAEIIRHAKDGGLGTWRLQEPGPPILRHSTQSAQDLEQIPRPPKIPGADEMGRSGVVGLDVFRPFTSERAAPLDSR
jgi:hypothetical protein